MNKFIPWALLGVFYVGTKIYNEIVIRKVCNDLAEDIHRQHCAQRTHGDC